ncbi:MAG: ATPase, T2SS/T4P/T4SS family [Methylophilus sp.]|nr:ATPase, T2SS/T4P/T4SS family [Methylophilus sp.]
MFKVYISHPEQATQIANIDEKNFTIGKSRDCQIRLDGWRVSKSHARAYQTAVGVYIQDLGQFHGTYVNGNRIQQHGPILRSDNIAIGAYQLNIEQVITDETPAAQTPSPAPSHNQQYEKHNLHEANDIRSAAITPSLTVFHGWRKRIHEQLLDTIDLRRRDILHMEDAALRQETELLIREIIGREQAKPHADNPYVQGTLQERRKQIRAIQPSDYEKLVHDVLNEAVGLGPLEELLDDDTITEIMVNRYDEIYLERKGRLERHHTSFTSNRAVLGVIERIVAPLGRRIDESSPMVDARLKDGSRVNAVIPPLAIKGPTVTIRKFSQKALNADNLVAFHSISQAMATFLNICVLHRKNIIISGGTGSGKTTLLNVLSNFIPQHERIITIEDAAELKLDHHNLVSLEARPANAEGRGQVAIRDLVKNALRMRPDRIVVGECRGGEALDMLQAMNTGHEGSLTTLHANSARDALARLETLILMAGMDLPITAIREQIASAVDIIIQQGRLTDGQRVVTSISEITGIESGKIQLQELFKFEQLQRNKHGRIVGRFSGCNVTPHFYQGLREAGFALDIALFNQNLEGELSSQPDMGAAL